jgi:hypothetical protein
MSSRERLLAAIRHEPLDRVPISTHELVGWNPNLWENQQPSYDRLMNLVREKTDCIYLLGFPRVNRRQETTVERWTEGDSHYTRTIIHTPRGDLQELGRRDEGVNTTWRVERLLKTDEDVARFLSIPYELEAPDMSSVFEAQARLGDMGITQVSITDPICEVAGRFRFEDFLERAFFQPEQIMKMLDVLAPRVYEFLDVMLEQGAGPMIRIVGPEYITAPYLPPRFFERFVVDYDLPMVQRIHDYDQYVRMHCHGNIRDVLGMMADMEIDALDPVEGPPSGDITLEEAKACCGDRVCLMGNIQLRDLELAEPDEMERITREAIEAGKPGGGFIILPTAAPYDVPLSPKTERNYEIFIETSLRYGYY